MLLCILNNPAAVGDELIGGHISFGVIGLPADDFKVRDRLCCDVINVASMANRLLWAAPWALASSFL